MFLALLLRVCKVREEQWEIKEEAQEPWAISLFSTKKPLWWGGKSVLTSITMVSTSKAAALALGNRLWLWTRRV